MSVERYSRVAMALHWAIAAALAFQIGLGWRLEKMGAEGFAQFQLHKSIGITILVLTIVRIAVRSWKPRPAPIEGGFPGLLAKAVHFGLYLFMLGGPLTGWALVSTARVKVPTLIFGTVPLPHLPLPRGAHAMFETAHGLLAWIGIGLLALHVAGAARHHLFQRDGLVWRMVPGRSYIVMAILLALLPAAFFLGQGLGSPSGSVREAAENKAAEKVEIPAVEAPVSKATPPSPAVAAAEIANAAQAPAEDNAGPPPHWTVRPGGHLGFSVGSDNGPISGSFSRWTAAIVMDPDRPETADIQVDVDLSSASVGDPTQDAMLSGEDFFAATAHPKAIFRAKGAQEAGVGRYRARGMLTLKGISAPQAIRFSLSGTGERRTVKGAATIERQGFAIGTGDAGATLSPSVSVDFSFVAEIAKP